MSMLARVQQSPAALTRSSLRRATVRPVKALFGKSGDAERKKEEQWEAQQALLAERRAKKERLMQRGQSQLPKTPSHHMLSGPNPDFAANPPAGKVRVTPRTTFNRKEAKGSQAAPEPAAKSAPAPKRPTREEVVVEVEEEEPARPAGGNPLSGLLGGLFGKK
eukprot:XP_001699962.1 predicted protein [Chlamydomonas reinhardtii]